MVRMTYKHVDAIARCRFFVLPALKRFPEARAKAEIERDLELLLEVRSFINELLISPQLPLGNIQNGNPNEPTRDRIG